MPSEGASFALRVELGGHATSFTAMEASNTDNLVSNVSTSGGVLTITYTSNTGIGFRMATITLTTMGLGTSIGRTLALTQVPPPIVGDVVLDSAEAITDRIRSATHIQGNLTIGDGGLGEAIDNSDLAMLQVEEIGGNLTLNRTELTRLDAFSSLRRVGGDLRIGGSNPAGDGNSMLVSVAGFGVLGRVEG